MVTLLLPGALLMVGAGTAQAPTNGHSWDAPFSSTEVHVGEDDERTIAGELLITLEEGADIVDVSQALEGRGFRTLGAVERFGVLRVRVPAGSSAEGAASSLGGMDGVHAAELHGVGRGGLLPNMPDDTHYFRQWHHRNDGTTGGTAGADIETEGAWAITLGDPGVVVAVLDTGMDFNHPEFAGRTVPGYDYVNEDADATADHPHGIQVSGIVGAVGNNGLGTSGVDRRCTIHPVKILNQSNLGSTFDLIQGLDHCAQENVDIVCMSLINFPGTSALETALAGARAKGCILVSCGSNSGGAGINWPGRSVHTMAIAASDNQDRRASFSSFAPEIDFIAPGRNIATTSTSFSDTFTNFSGCSAATPVAAGVVALLKARSRVLTQPQVYEILRLGAEDQVGPANEDTPGRDDYFGHGRLNARNSLELVDLVPILEGRRCSPAAANSSGNPGRMVLEGSASLTRDELVLRAVNLPQNQFGLFVMGDVFQVVPISSSPSPLCVFGGTLSRVGPFVLSSGASGSFEVSIQPTAVPGHGPIGVGESWGFQAWHRDTGGTSNLTDSVDVTFF